MKDGRTPAVIKDVIVEIGAGVPLGFMIRHKLNSPFVFVVDQVLAGDS
jgi:hypothetical protein